VTFDAFEVVYANVVTCHGVELAMVDVAVTRAPTRRRPPDAHVLLELRTAALQDRVGKMAPRTRDAG
jgi:hypothetical protein